MNRIEHMGISVRIASADAAIRQELAEQLTLAGYTCAGEQEEAALSLTDRSDALILSSQELPKPVRLSTLLAQINALTQDRMLAQGWIFSPSKRQLARETHAVPLTEKEVALLSALLSAPGKAGTRAALLEQVWGYGDDISTHTLETHMHRLRAKLKDTPVAVETTPQGYMVTA